MVFNWILKGGVFARRGLGWTVRNSVRGMAAYGSLQIANDPDTTPREKFKEEAVFAGTFVPYVGPLILLCSLRSASKDFHYTKEQVIDKYQEYTSTLHLNIPYEDRYLDDLYNTLEYTIRDREDLNFKPFGDSGPYLTLNILRTMPLTLGQSTTDEYDFLMDSLGNNQALEEAVMQKNLFLATMSIHSGANLRERFEDNDFKPDSQLTLIGQALRNGDMQMAHILYLNGSESVPERHSAAFTFSDIQEALKTPMINHKNDMALILIRNMPEKMKTPENINLLITTALRTQSEAKLKRIESLLRQFNDINSLSEENKKAILALNNDKLNQKIGVTNSTNTTQRGPLLEVTDKFGANSHLCERVYLKNNVVLELVYDNYNDYENHKYRTYRKITTTPDGKQTIYTPESEKQISYEEAQALISAAKVQEFNLIASRSDKKPISEEEGKKIFKKLDLKYTLALENGINIDGKILRYDPKIGYILNTETTYTDINLKWDEKRGWLYNDENNLHWNAEIPYNIEEIDPKQKDRFQSAKVHSVPYSDKGMSIQITKNSDGSYTADYPFKYNNETNSKVYLRYQFNKDHSLKSDQPYLLVYDKNGKVVGNENCLPIYHPSSVVSLTAQSIEARMKQDQAEHIKKITNNFNKGQKLAQIHQNCPDLFVKLSVELLQDPNNEDGQKKLYEFIKDKPELKKNILSTIQEIHPQELAIQLYNRFLNSLNNNPETPLPTTNTTLSESAQKCSEDQQVPESTRSR